MRRKECMLVWTWCMSVRPLVTFNSLTHWPTFLKRGPSILGSRETLYMLGLLDQMPRSQGSIMLKPFPINNSIKPWHTPSNHTSILGSRWTPLDLGSMGRVQGQGHMSNSLKALWTIIQDLQYLVVTTSHSGAYRFNNCFILYSFKVDMN